MNIRKPLSDTLRQRLLCSGVAFGNIKYGSYVSTALQKRLFDHFDFDVVLDIGANRGQFAVELRKILGYHGPIVSFEPAPDLAEHLRAAAKRDPLWHVEEVALSDTDGTAEFNIMATDVFNSLSTPSERDTEAYRDGNKVQKTIEVRTAKLDSIFNNLMKKLNFKKPYLKLDTQGYDLIVLKGAEESLPVIPAIQSEVAVKRLYESSLGFAETVERFQSYGYALCGFAPVSYRPFPEATELDGFFVRPVS